MVCASLDPSVPSAPSAGGPLPDPQLALLTRMAALEARVAALEGAREESLPEPEAAAAVPEAEAIPGGTVLGLAGRTCLILGGAFLIRSLTDSGMVPAPAGVAMGLGYSALWALLAHRSAAKGQGPWAAFQVFAAAAIALPLLWETTVRLKVMPPALAAAALLLWTGLFAAVAIRHGLRRVAWITLLGALATGFGLMAATSAITAFAPFFLLSSAASLLLADSEAWRGLRWPTGLAADLAIGSMVLLTLSPGGSEALARDLRPNLVLATALALVGVHLGAFLYRTLNRPKAVGAYEVFQTLAVLGVGYLGAVRVAQASGGGLALLGFAALLFGLGCYGCAFAFVEKQTEGSLDFKYLTSLAIVLVLAGSFLVLDHQTLALVCLATGVAITLLGVHHGKFSLQLHGALFLAVAALDSGLLADAAGGYLAAVPPGLGGFSPAAYLTFAGLVAAHLHPLERRGGADLSWQARLPSLGFGALAVFALGGLAASGLGAFLRDPGALAALRTAILVGLAAGTAAVGRWKPASELGWLSYPILGCAALKLIVQDLPNGRPATLFLAMSLFGVGLLVVPRLLGRVKA